MRITGKKTTRKLWLALLISLAIVTLAIAVTAYSILAEDWNARSPRFVMTITGVLGIGSGLWFANFGIKHYRAAPDSLEIEVTEQLVRLGEESISISPNAKIRIDIRASSIRAKRFSIFVFEDDTPVLEDHGNFIHTISAIDFAKAMPTNIQVKLYTPYERDIADYT